MTPCDFPEANTTFTSPPDLEGSCRDIRAFHGQAQGGIFDGAPQVVVAWRPSDEELRRINEGQPIFLSVMGGLPPHYVGTSFEEVTSG